MSFRGIVAGKLSSNPSVKDFSEDESRKMLQVILRIDSGRYDRLKRERVIDTFAVTATGRAAEKASKFEKGDEVVALCELHPEEKFTKYVCDEISRVGDEGMNVHFLVGAVERLKTDYTDSGDTVSNGTIRCPRNWTDKDGNEHRSADWLRFTAWKKSADHIDQYFTPTEDKCRWITLQGITKVRSYVDKDGVKKQSTELTVRNFEFTNMYTPKYESQKTGHESGPSKSDVDDNQSNYSYTPPADDDDQDIPF